MTFEEALRRSIESYFRGIEPEKVYKDGMTGRPKYTKKFFDKFEQDKFGKSISEEIKEKGWNI